MKIYIIRNREGLEVTKHGVKFLNVLYFLKNLLNFFKTCFPVKLL
jgi:hypothetical protein